MPPPQTTHVEASATIPYLFRFPLLYLEPFFALNGAILTLIAPHVYTKSMTRGALHIVNPLDQFIYTELSGGWLYFAFVEAVVLRLVDDVRVWRLLCMGMLLSDILYCHSCAQAVGGWKEWVVVSQWTMEDWVVAITTWPFLIARLGIVFGIGQANAAPARKKRL